MLHLRHYKEKARAFFWSLMYEYKCAADWGADTGRVLKLRINKWTGDIKVIEETIIRDAGITYRTI